MRLYFLLVLGFLWTVTTLHAQSNLSDLMSEANSQVGEVLIEEDTYRQEWSVSEDQPYRITFRQESIDKKGKSEEYLYEFNLADFNDRQVLRETNRNRMFVLMRTQGQMAAIKTFKDGEQANYEKEIEIVVAGPDEAEALMDIMKAAIPLAKEMDEERIVPQDFNSALEAALSRVKDVTVNEDNYEQVLRLQGSDLPILEFETRIPKGKTDELKLSTFNLADVGEPVKFSIRGDKVQVNLRTKGNLKYIGQVIDGEPGNYVNSMDILMEDVEQARDLAKLLDYCIPEAGKKLKEVLPQLDESQNSSSAISEQVGEVNQGSTTFAQSLTPECQTEFTVTETDEKSTSTSVLSFHLGDMNGAQAQIEVKGKAVGVSIPAKGKSRLVKNVTDEEFKGYISEIFIQTSGVETARMLEHRLPAATKWCNENRVRLAPSGSLEEKLSWAAEKIEAYRGPDGEMQQELRWEADEPCDLTYELTDSKMDGYEFRLEDLGEKQIELAISSKELSIKLGTLKDQDLIKYYRDGEMKKYTDRFTFSVDELPVARDMVTIFREMAESCKE